MNIKLSKLMLPTIAIGALLMTNFQSVAMASPDGHGEQMQMSQERMHDHMQAKLDKLAERLEIKSSQQSVWEEFTKSVEPLMERNMKKPADDADAATIARNRADRATEFAKKLTKIADATAKLQAALTDDQRKIFNQVSRRFSHRHHGWQGNNHERGHEGHGWGQRGVDGKDGRHDGQDKDSW